ncbi:hypothetical protein ACFFRR_010114 [Megaselia abdita]
MSSDVVVACLQIFFVSCGDVKQKLGRLGYYAAGCSDVSFSSNDFRAYIKQVKGNCISLSETLSCLLELIHQIKNFCCSSTSIWPFISAIEGGGSSSGSSSEI